MNLYYLILSSLSRIFNYEIILDSERSDECIYFTMMCVFLFIYFFFVSVISNRNNALIFNFSILFHGKVNLVGSFGRPFFKIPNSFQSVGKNKRKIKEKWEFLHKICFRKNRFYFYFYFLLFYFFFL